MLFMILFRLLSAYRDKINTLTPKPFQPYFLALQQAIIKKYRPLNSTITSPCPTFSEFVDYVIDSTEHLKTAKDWTEKVSLSFYYGLIGMLSSL